MRLDRCVIALRPRSAVESLDLACRVIVGPARKIYVVLSAIVLLPAYVGCLVLRHAAGLSWLWVWVVAASLAAILQGVFTIAVSRLLFTDTLGARVVLRAAAKRYPAFVGAQLAKLGVLALTGLSLFVLAVPALSGLLFVPEASLLEGAAPMAALARARAGRRVASEMPKVLLLLAAQAFIVLAADRLGDGIVDGVLQLGAPFGSLLSEGGSPYALLGLFAAVPYLATARFLLYIDDRTRADGWDVQVRLMAIAAGETAVSREAA